MNKETTGGAPLPIYDNRAPSTAVASPVQGTASATDPGAAVNHAEAYELACLKRANSNLARSYLDLRAALAERAQANLTADDVTFLHKLSRHIGAGAGVSERDAGRVKSIAESAERAQAQPSGAVQDERAAWRQWYFDPNRKGSTFGYQDTREGHHEAFQRKSEAAWMERASRATPAPEQEAAPPEFSTDPDGEIALDWHVGADVLSVSTGPRGVSFACTMNGKSYSGSREFEQEAAQVAPPGAQETVYSYECRQPHTDPAVWCEFFNRDKPESDPTWVRNVRLYTAPVPATTPEWTCFHCDERFTDRDAAALHFGTSERQDPICKVSRAEYRAMETRMVDYNNEDADIHRQMHRQRIKHHQAIQRAEEAGYARGLRDAPAITPAEQTDPIRALQADARQEKLDDFVRAARDSAQPAPLGYVSKAVMDSLKNGTSLMAAILTNNSVSGVDCAIYGCATATNTNQPDGDPKCWSCKREYTDEQRTQADGDCPHCGVERPGPAPHKEQFNQLDAGQTRDPSKLKGGPK